MVLVVVVVVVVIVGAAVDVLILTFGISGLLSAILLGLFPFVLILYLGGHYWAGLGVYARQAVLPGLPSAGIGR